MRYMLSILLLMILTHTISAEEITTGNLLPNSTGAASNLQSVDNSIPNVQSSCSSFTSVNTTCTNSNWNYQEVEVGSTSSGTGTLNYTGSLVDIETGNETSTQPMLDNGITLDSTTIVQNCEWSGSSHQCGQARSGQDQFKTTVKILDSSGNILSQTDQIRNTDSGYNSNADKYTDQVIYNSIGSNKFDWTWTGIDNGSSLVDLGGPNLLGAKLTMTYDNTVLEAETSTALTSLEEDLEELQNIIFEEIFETVEFKEEIELSFTLLEEPLEEEFEEISFKPILTLIQESVMEEEEIIMEPPTSIMEETKNFSTALLPPITTEEEIYEEKEEIIASILPMVSKEEETITEEEETISTGPIQMESTEEEPKTLLVKKEETITNEKETTEEEKEPEIKEEKEEVKEEKEEVTNQPTEVVGATNEEETEETESTSTASTTSVVSSKENTKQKNIQSKKTLVANIGKVMDKVDKEIKDISKNLEIKNLIKHSAMASEQVSLGVYSGVEFYKPKDIYLNQVIIADTREIYGNVTLVQYTDNDIIKAKQERLYDIKLKKRELINKLETLKNG